MEAAKLSSVRHGFCSQPLQIICEQHPGRVCVRFGKDWVRLLNILIQSFYKFSGFNSGLLTYNLQCCEQKYGLTELSLAASIKSLYEHDLHSLDSIWILTKSEMQKEIYLGK